MPNYLPSSVMLKNMGISATVEEIALQMKTNFEASVKNGNWDAVADYVVGYMAIAVERSEMNVVK